MRGCGFIKKLFVTIHFKRPTIEKDLKLFPNSAVLLYFLKLAKSTLSGKEFDNFI